MTKSKAPVRLQGLLNAALPFAVSRRLPGPEMLRAWLETVGPVLGAKAQPVCLEEGGTLVVAVSGSAWRQELTLAAGQVVEGLCKQGLKVSGLKLVKARTPPAISPPPPAPDISLAEESQVEELVAPVRDPDLRQALAGLLRAQIKARKAGRK